MVPPPCSEPISATGLKPVPCTSSESASVPVTGGRAERAQQARGIDAGERDLAMRGQAVVAGSLNAERAGQPAAGHDAGHVVERQLILAQPQRGAEFARGQPRQQLDLAQLAATILPAKLPKAPAPKGSSGPGPGGAIAARRRSACRSPPRSGSAPATVSASISPLDAMHGRRASWRAGRAGVVPAMLALTSLSLRVLGRKRHAAGETDRQAASRPPPMPRKGAASARVTLRAQRRRWIVGEQAARCPRRSPRGRRRSAGVSTCSVAARRAAWPSASTLPGLCRRRPAGSSPSMATKALPSSALSLPVKAQIADAQRLAHRPAPCPASASVTLPRLPSMSSLASPAGSAAAERQLRMQLGRRHGARARSASACAVLGAKRSQQRHHRRHGGRVEIDRDAALRRRPRPAAGRPWPKKRRRRDRRPIAGRSASGRHPPSRAR